MQRKKNFNKPRAVSLITKTPCVKRDARGSSGPSHWAIGIRKLYRLGINTQILRYFLR
jgi:hypothetical protein